MSVEDRQRMFRAMLGIPEEQTGWEPIIREVRKLVESQQVPEEPVFDRCSRYVERIIPTLSEGMVTFGELQELSDMLDEVSGQIRRMELTDGS